ncbi:MAG: MFS transporter [Bdellovibrionales bacterium]|nr:MFS transporter [Bdellovibrionales bacterium]
MATSIALKDPTEDQRRILTRWRISTFWVMLVGYIGYYLCRGNLPVAVPLLSKQFGYTNTELGIILSVSELMYAVGKFTTGPFADRIGGKKVFMIGMVGAIVFNLIFPSLSSILAFTIVWSLCRYFLSMGWGGIIKTIGEWYEPEKNGTVMGLISINFQFGSVLVSIFCGALIAWGVGWKGLFYYPAAIVSLLALWSFFASKESPQDVFTGIRFGKNAGKKKALADFGKEKKEGFAHSLNILKTLFKVPMFRQLLVFSFVIHILRSIFLFWTPKFLVDLGQGDVKAAMTSAVFPLLGCIGTILLGWYTDRFVKNGDRTRIMSWMLFGLFLSLLATAVLIPMGLKHEVGIIVLLGLSGFFLYGPYSMSAGALSLDIAGAEGAGTCTGMIDGVGYIGGAVAAWGAGIMSDHFGGWSQVFVVLAFTGLFTALWTFYMSWHFRKGKSKS